MSPASQQDLQAKISAAWNAHDPDATLPLTIYECLFESTYPASTICARTWEMRSWSGSMPRA
jgi:hypothetical protein